jgi:vacuolar protein sorting-associated protein 33A
VVMFIGGVTFAEVAALRFLASRPDSEFDFVVATTKLINGNTLIESFIDESVRLSMLRYKLG